MPTIMCTILRALLLSVSVIAAARGDVPAAARLKAAAEAGDASAQYQFAASFGGLSKDWYRWMEASAAQDFGPAQDELAWTPNWAVFGSTFPDPRMRASHLRSNGTKMREAVVRAATAADKGFARSRLILAMAYADGYVLPLDLVEAYKWLKLAQTRSDLLGGISAAGLRDRLLKTMSLPQVKEGETRAESYRPGATASTIRTAVILPGLKLTGIMSSGTSFVAIVNGNRMTAGQERPLNIDGITVNARCLSIDSKSVMLSLLPESTKVALAVGRPAEVVH